MDENHEYDDILIQMSQGWDFHPENVGEKGLGARKMSKKIESLIEEGGDENEANLSWQGGTFFVGTIIMHKKDRPTD
jgi:hypothetical protein